MVAFGRYRQAVEFGYAYTLARSPGGLVTRPGGAEAAQRQVRRARLLVQAALWALALGPIILAVILLVGPIRRGRRRR